MLSCSRSNVEYSDRVMCSVLGLCNQCICIVWLICFFFFQAEDGIRDLVRSRGLGDVYKRQEHDRAVPHLRHRPVHRGDER